MASKNHTHRKVLVVSRGRKSAPKLTAPKEEPHALIEKAVIASEGSGFFYGVVKRVDGSSLAMVRPSILDASGVLVAATDAELIPVPISCLKEVTHQSVREGVVKAWSHTFPYETKFTEIKAESGRVEDYLDVTISGMASIFRTGMNGDVDRDQEYILEGAFSKTLPRFMKNPVMLLDHANSTGNLAGSYTKVSSVEGGLGVEGKISNAPGLRDIRFKVAEGHLRAFSIGGFFFYKEGTYNAIEEVELFEITLTPIPADQDALFRSRSLTLGDAKKAFRHNQRS